MWITRFIRHAATAAVCAGLMNAAVSGPAGAAESISSRAATIDRLETYLNGLLSLQADFIQVAPDGSISEGMLYLARPGGRIRLEYAPPSQLLIVGGDGWITLLDRATNEDSRWPVGGTPFEVLIGDKVDFKRDVIVRKLHQSGGITRLTIEAKGNSDAGSLTLVFSDNPLELRQWQVLDAQHLTTTVTLGVLHSNVAFDSGLFVHDDLSFWHEDDDG